MWKLLICWNTGLSFGRLCLESFTDMFLYVQHLLNNIPEIYSACVIWLAVYYVMKL